jgi:hypothetical protein
MGALGTQLRNALAPVARSLVADVGRSTVQIRRPTVTGRNADNSEIRTYPVVTGGSALSCPILEVTEEAAAREWGTMEKVTAVAIISDSIDIKAKDGVIVSAGDYAGTHFRVIDVHPAPMAGLTRVALQTTQERYS